MDIQRATTFLAEAGYKVKFVNLIGDTGIAVLTDGRRVRFWLPDDPAQPAVINVLQPQAA